MPSARRTPRRTPRHTRLAPLPQSAKSAKSVTDALMQLNDHHARVIFPNAFTHLSFDDVKEIEYHFDVKEGIVVVTHSECFFSSDRNTRYTVSIHFEHERGKMMGKWIAETGNFAENKSYSGQGKIGFTANQQHIDAAVDNNYKVLVNAEIANPMTVGL